MTNSEQGAGMTPTDLALWVFDRRPGYDELLAELKKCVDRSQSALQAKVADLEKARDKERKLQDHLIQNALVGWQGYYNAYSDDDDEDSAFALGQIMALERLQKRREALRPDQGDGAYPDKCRCPDDSGSCDWCQDQLTKGDPKP